MTNAEYHAHPAVSKSDLDLINRSPLHFITAKKYPAEPTESLLLGSVVHKLVLEPDTFSEEFAAAPEINRRTKSGKAEFEAFMQENAGKTVISADMYDRSLTIADSVRKHPVAAKLLSGGQAEQSFFWTDRETGVQCKCRPDYLRDKLVIDLKTTSDASPEAFEKSACSYRYHVQAWWYLHGLKCNNFDVRDFVFIAVEKTPPYAVCVYAADDSMLDLGERQALENLRTYAQCTQSGIWYGYDSKPQIHSLSLPDFVIRKYF